ncbi:MAG: 2-C-methyl-D-erythritol 4-phosphate cytidylyltransferase [Nitrospirota bacterium]|jgi:2-C-methyl-D-erythritol 4-phosphate cytidylyltransferase
MPRGVVVAVVPAAGLGRRLGTNKAFAFLEGRPLLDWVLTTLEGVREVAEVIPALKRRDMQEGARLIEEGGFRKVKKIAPGGEERQDSVMNALRLIDGEARTVLVHDGARPLLTPGIVRAVLAGLAGHDGAVAAVPVKDTVKEAGEGNLVKRTLRRDTLWAVQTPQCFPYETLLKAYESAARAGVRATDDASLVEREGGRVALVPGSYENIKVTTPEDLVVAEALLRKRREGP